MSTTLTCTSQSNASIGSEVDYLLIWQHKPNWIKESEILSYICNWNEIQKFQQVLAPCIMFLKNESETAHFKEFYELKTVILIWRGIKFETGRDCGTQDNISAAIKSLPIMDHFDISSLVCDEKWDAEGELDSPKGWKCMGEQAARSYFLLQVSIQRGYHLTIELVKQVHFILMSGGMDDCGEFRDSPAFAGQYAFAPHEDIEARMNKLVSSFEESVISETSHAIGVAVQLMLDFVTIHPFRNGNGRMCRLLFSYALQRMGFPFPVTLDSGHTNHYITALKQAQTRNKIGPILQLAILSVNATLTNYQVFSQNPEFLRIFSPSPR